VIEGSYVLHRSYMLIEQPPLAEAGIPEYNYVNRAIEATLRALGMLFGPGQTVGSPGCPRR